MNLLVVNSNTSSDITDLVAAQARLIARSDTRITPVTVPFGVRAIETPVDVEIAAKATETAIKDAPDQTDAAIIACFSDPGLIAIRKHAAFPVIGIAEAGMIHASLLGARFAILTVAPSSVGGIRKLALGYGYRDQLTGIHALKSGVLESHGNPDRTLEAFTQLAQEVLKAEHPDVFLLGGAITAGMAEKLSQNVPIPVLDGLSCAVRQAEIITSTADH